MRFWLRQTGHQVAEKSSKKGSPLASNSSYSSREYLTDSAAGAAPLQAATASPAQHLSNVLRFIFPSRVNPIFLITTILRVHFTAQ